jgi:hypothetical protein
MRVKYVNQKASWRRCAKGVVTLAYAHMTRKTLLIRSALMARREFQFLWNIICSVPMPSMQIKYAYKQCPKWLWWQNQTTMF